MKRSISGTIFAICVSASLLVACGVATQAPATKDPAAPNSTNISTTSPAGSTTVAATATRPSIGTPTARATAPGTPATTPSPDRPGTPRASATATRTARGPRYSLFLSEAVTIPDSDLDSDLTIRFKGVANDSRCPVSPMVVCAWAGEATVSFEATSGTESHTIVLTMPGLTRDTTERGDNPKTHMTYRGYVIQIVSLEPQPTLTSSPVGRGTAAIPLTPTSAPSQVTVTILVTVAP